MYTKELLNADKVAYKAREDSHREKWSSFKSIDDDGYGDNDRDTAESSHVVIQKDMYQLVHDLADFRGWTKTRALDRILKHYFLGEEV